MLGWFGLFAETPAVRRPQACNHPYLFLEGPLPPDHGAAAGGAAGSSSPASAAAAACGAAAAAGSVQENGSVAGKGGAAEAGGAAEIGGAAAIDDAAANGVHMAPTMQAAGRSQLVRASGKLAFLAHALPKLKATGAKEAHTLFNVSHLKPDPCARALGSSSSWRPQVNLGVYYGHSKRRALIHVLSIRLRVRKLAPLALPNDWPDGVTSFPTMQNECRTPVACMRRAPGAAVQPDDAGDGRHRGLPGGAAAALPAPRRLHQDGTTRQNAAGAFPIGIPCRLHDVEHFSTMDAPGMAIAAPTRLTKMDQHAAMR